MNARERYETLRRIESDSTAQANPVGPRSLVGVIFDEELRVHMLALNPDASSATLYLDADEPGPNGRQKPLWTGPSVLVSAGASFRPKYRGRYRVTITAIPDDDA